MSTALSPLLAPMLSSAAMRAVCDDEAYLQHMLDFEAALARAEAATGVIPANAAGPITKACKASSFDLADLAEAAARSGNLAIPLVKALTANVGRADAEAARYVHWGATSQDVIDTATMLTLRAGIDALDADLSRAIKGFAALARTHRNTAMVARTWLQHALQFTQGRLIILNMLQIIERNDGIESGIWKWKHVGWNLQHAISKQRHRRGNVAAIGVCMSPRAAGGAQEVRDCTACAPNFQALLRMQLFQRIQ